MAPDRVKAYCQWQPFFTHTTNHFVTIIHYNGKQGLHFTCIITLQGRQTLIRLDEVIRTLSVAMTGNVRIGMPLGTNGEGR